MILNLSLTVINAPGVIMPRDYSYCLSACIYKILSRGDAEYTNFLHNEGYGHTRSKFFTFSEIRGRMRYQDDTMTFLEPSAELTICFFMPEAAETFMKAVQLDPNFELVEYGFRTQFRIDEVENQMPELDDDVQTVILQPISPIVCGSKLFYRNSYTYIEPREPNWSQQLLYGVYQKYKTIYFKSDSEIQRLSPQVVVRPIFFDRPPVKRITTVKKNMPQQHSLRGYSNFNISLTAPGKLIEIVLHSGIGLHNSLGMGCVRLIKKIHTENESDSRPRKAHLHHG